MKDDIFDNAEDIFEEIDNIFNESKKPSKKSSSINESHEKGPLVKCVLSENNVNLGSIEDSTAISYSEQKKLLETAETVDKSDLFDHLIISPDEYAFQPHKVKGGEELNFGIQIDDTVHLNTNGRVLFDYQINAVKHFLGQFRGVGILADEVGMGKTFETAVIVSELAERKLVDSILVVAAHEENAKDWLDVFGDKFGLSGFITVESMIDILKNCNNNIPKAPMIITFKNFCKIDRTKIKLVLFDIVVVDEAHNFTEMEDGKKGMAVLMNEMVVKKANNKPYCILVSATPHKGNLDSMFPLWYFIKGGNGDVEREKKHYREYLCHNSTTVAEFIESYAEEELTKNSKYQAFLKNKLTELKKAYPNEYNSMAKMRAQIFRNEFLSLPENDDIAKKIKYDTKVGYSNLLNSFMIRQSRTISVGRASKNSINYMFFRVPTESSQIVTFSDENLPFSHGSYSFTYNCRDFYANKVITYKDKEYSLHSFAEKICDSSDSKKISQLEHFIVFSAMKKLNAFKLSAVPSFDNQSNNMPLDGERPAYEKFYFDNTKPKDGVEYRFEIIDQDKTFFEEKADKLVAIMSSEEMKKHRAIVFFDYYNKQASDEPKRLEKYLKTHHPSFSKRLLICPDNEKAVTETIKKLRSSEDAIFLSPENMSESANLQFCDLIINFSICHSPIKMDQRIGRVDRIGQSNKEINIISFAGMNALEGYLLTFFNKIRLFSGWKDDIILVTGCDNKNSITMKCDECATLVRYYDGVVSDKMPCPVPNCKGTLIKGGSSPNYRCPEDGCTNRFEIIDTAEKTTSRGYVCNQTSRVKLIGMPAEEPKFYFCDKRCIIERCAEHLGKSCPVTEAIKKGSREKNPKDLNQLMLLCAKCNLPDNKRICDHCHMEINSIGYNRRTQEQINNACINSASFNKGRYEHCPHLNCSFLQSAPPYCKEHHVKMQPIMPTTFDEFAEEIWMTSGSRFVQDFEFEIEKIDTIVNTLGNID